MQSSSKNSAVTPSVAQVIAPDLSLKKAVGVGTDMEKVITEEKVIKAQGVVKEEEKNYLPQVLELVKQMEQWFATLTPQESMQNTEMLQKISFSALDIKGKAGMFNFGIATDIADSLHKFLRNPVELNARNLTVLKGHIDALLLVFSQNMTGHDNPIANALIKELKSISSPEE